MSKAALLMMFLSVEDGYVRCAHCCAAGLCFLMTSRAPLMKAYTREMSFCANDKINNLTRVQKSFHTH